MAVDPRFATNYNRTDDELEEFFIFSICVAGKNAKSTAEAVHKLLERLQAVYSYNLPKNPLALIRNIRHLYGQDFSADLHVLAQELKMAGIVYYNQLSGRLLDIAHRDINLRTCTVEDLESLNGVGSKTARFFVLHSRANARVAALDTHILKWLNSQGVKAPKSTPPKGSKKYKELELTFLQLADSLGKSPATLDLEIWNDYSRNGLTKRKVRSAGKEVGAGASTL